MHDTPQRELFEKPTRLYSHGCMRVQNPGRLAELLLEEDKGWSATQVRSLLAQGYNNEVPLTKYIPVHVTYFTMIVEDNGEVKHFADVYGHDSRVVAALTGRRLPPEAAPSDDTYREASRRPATKYKQSADNPFSALFGN
jgi:murein L,D-transpeptidase YcbB/YkuD